MEAGLQHIIVLRIIVGGLIDSVTRGEEHGKI
jgi:hypothetical protein